MIPHELNRTIRKMIAYAVEDDRGQRESIYSRFEVPQKPLMLSELPDDVAGFLEQVRWTPVRFLETEWISPAEREICRGWRGGVFGRWPLPGFDPFRQVAALDSYTRWIVPLPGRRREFREALPELLVWGAVHRFLIDVLEQFREETFELLFQEALRREEAGDQHNADRIMRITMWYTDGTGSHPDDLLAAEEEEGQGPP